MKSINCFYYLLLLQEFISHIYVETYVGTIKEDNCTICFYFYSSEVTSLGSFVSKRLNLYSWTVKSYLVFIVMKLWRLNLFIDCMHVTNYLNLKYIFFKLKFILKEIHY